MIKKFKSNKKPYKKNHLLLGTYVKFKKIIGRIKLFKKFGRYHYCYYY